MIRRYRWYLVKAFHATDLVIIIVTWLSINVWLYQDLELDILARIPSIGVLIVCWSFVASLFSLYRSNRFVPLWEELSEITFVVGIFAGVVYLLTGLSFLVLPNPILFGIGVWFGAITLHLLLRYSLQYTRLLGFNLRRVIIYDAGDLGQMIARKLVERPEIGIQVIGFLDDERVDKVVRFRDKELSVLGKVEDIRHIIADHDIHEVVAALPFNAQAKLRKLVRETSELSLHIGVVPDLFEVTTVKASSGVVEDIPVVAIRYPCIEGIDALVKRAFDIIVASLGMIVVAPIMLLIAVFIKLDSEGPILFRQERVGLNGKPFQIYKFRTMVVHAEKQLDDLIKLDHLDQPMFKINNDPRVTKVGRILRKLSLDELPQLFNVLMGTMSLVGPRPEETRIVRMYSLEQRQRLAVKPGITGPMQVNGRGDLNFDERLELEIDYIKNYSFFRDLVLLVQTVPAVLLGKGAH